MESLKQDIRYAARSLRNAPGFTLVAALTIAIGIGATTTVFSVISALLLKPLPVASLERLFTLDEAREGSVESNMGYPVFRYARLVEYREASREIFAGLAGYSHAEGSLRLDGFAEEVNVVPTTANLFEVLGVRPAIGSGFSPDAERLDLPEAVISHALWTSRFGSDPGVLGNTVHLNGRSYEVVGVAPAGFTGLMIGLPADLWVPVDVGDGTPGSGEGMAVVGRLRDGVSREQAAAAATVISQQVPPEPANTTVRAVHLRPLAPLPYEARGMVLGFMGILLATAGLVLVISSTNVGAMMLTRAAARRREIAVRLAMGAGRGRLVQQLLVESVMLFSIGAAGGVLLTVWLTRLASSVSLPLPVRVAFDIGVDLWVLGFATALALLTGTVFGLAPALQSTRAGVLPALRDGDRGGSIGRSRLRGAFVVIQLAISLVLLVSAGLLVQTLRQVLATDIGFVPAGVVVGNVDLAPHGYDEERARQFHATLLERVRSLPGIESAALAAWPPMSGNSWTGSIRDAARGDDADPVNVSFGYVGSGYLETVRIPLVAGRDFGPADLPGSPRVAIVNQTLAGRLWPNASPVGQRIRSGETELEVIGVARDGRYHTFTEEPVAYMYSSLDQRPFAGATLHVRSRGDAAGTLLAVRRELAALDPNLALKNARSLESSIGFSVFPQRLAAAVIGVFGLVGVLLAAIGLYGILAYQVSMRTREIGIRMALGARANNVVRVVLRQSLRLVLAGIGVGLLAAFGVTRLLANLLYGVSPTDPTTFVAVSLLMASVALLASYLPARRATRVDPMTALRAE
jgi:predicted permease